MITPFVMLVAALAGAGGGFALRVGIGAPAAHGADAAEEKAHAGRTAASRGEKDDSHEKPSAAHGEEKAASTFMKFSRQFVTPIVVAGKPTSMMILDVNIEVDPALSGSIYAQEPRLRDAMLRVLLKQASDGSLEKMLADPSVLEDTRAQMLVEARAIAGDGVLSVLIMDVGYQDL
ncbi:MAG: hypothetical protein HXY21_14015 [Parvularculaceae bacterium]|nr:hypothetical protein [Parvularculaceae bacterium]